MASVKKHSLDIGGGVTVGGTADVITITTNQAISSAHQAAGFSFRFKAGGTNTTAVTVAVDGLSAQPVERVDGSALSAGDIVSGGIYDLAYNATNSGYTLMGSTTGTVTASGTNAFTGTNSFSVAPRPSANDAAALGVSGTAWSDLFLASGGVINWNAGNVTMTHSAGQLTIVCGGGDSISFTDEDITVDGDVVVLRTSSAADLLLDTLGTETKGALIYHNGSSWVVLAPP
jgi:hypothetical protein